MNPGIQTDAEPVVERTVAVMMPFGGGDPNAERRQALEFQRVKYLIEERLGYQPEWLRGVKVQYRVQVFKAIAGEISEGAIDLITGADVLIGLITAANVNVIFEIGLRTLFRDAPILIIKGDPNVLLPLYLRGSAYIDYSDVTPRPITQTIDAIANDPVTFPVVSFEGEIPERLLKSIDRDDQTLLDRLHTAFGLVLPVHGAPHPVEAPKRLPEVPDERPPRRSGRVQHERGVPGSAPAPGRERDRP
jgi:hypothetical protein